MQNRHMTIFNQRFAEAVRDGDLRFAQIARRLKDVGYNRTRQAVAGWAKTSPGTEPELEIIKELAVILGRDPSWLAPHLVNQTIKVEGLPLLGKIAAGVWQEVAESQDQPPRRPVAPDPRYPIESQFLLEVEGQSINRVARHGSLVTCVDVHKARLEARHGDLVVVTRKRGGLEETTVKRLRSASGAFELWPESDDPAHQEKLTLKGGKGDTVEIIAIAIWTSNPIPRGD